MEIYRQCGGLGIVGKSPPKRRRRWRQMKERFLPTQEWSSGGRECIAKNTPPNVHRRRPKCQNRPRFPFPRKTIPAKAGISQCSAYKYRQIPTILRPQVDHSCEGRNLIATCRQRRRILGGGRVNADNSANCGTRHCEIPAYAGMVSGGRECIAKNTPPNVHRRRPKCQNRPRFPFPARPFLRKQESHSAVHTNIGKSPTIPRPPQDHSCVGRNLIATCRQRRRILGADGEWRQLGELWHTTL